MTPLMETRMDHPRRHRTMKKRTNPFQEVQTVRSERTTQAGSFREVCTSDPSSARLATKMKRTTGEIPPWK